MTTWRVMLLSLYVLAANIDGWAAHIFGGDFSMAATATPGRYILTLNIHADLNTLTTGNTDEMIIVHVFRKKDNVRMDSFTLTRQLTTNIIYKNVACAGTQGLRTTELRYTSEITLNISTYNDPEGYYVIWERCCRTAGVDNLVNRGQNVGMAYRLEFPALTQNGRFFKNSSPEFTTPNGDYICINKPFKMSMKATDGDGDELRYSLVTPLQGYTTNTQTDDKIGLSHSSYPEVKWATGYGLSNVIPGKPALAVDAQTGLLTVTANELGLFVFTVLVEEYRNGVRIGSVRRDFQLKVVDCGGDPPPMPTVFEGTNTRLPASTVEICEGGTVDLFFSGMTDVLYQWSLDGINLPNETKNTLKAKEIGEYQVSASYAKKCTNDTISQVVKVVMGRGPNARLNPSDTVKICEGDAATLIATADVNFKYEWFRNGATIANETKNTLSTKQMGNYMVAVTGQGITCPTRDTVAVVFRATPTKPTISAAKTVLCTQDSIQLNIPAQTGFSVEWRRGTQVVGKSPQSLYVKQADNYQVRIFSGSCEVTSDPILITQAPPNPIIFDSLKSVCINDSALISFKATPIGGKFRGNGVENQTFNAQKAGVGRHIITYETTLLNVCPVQKSRILEVKATPVVQLPKSLTQVVGSDIVLPATVDNAVNEQYRWVPPTGLSDPNIRQPTAKINETTTYTLTVTSSNGCSSKASVRIFVADLIFIPDAFTPNNDGLNDTFEIRNIGKFPKAEVYVYNRWGEVIFYQANGYQNPWDGRYKGEIVASDEYTYVIVPHSEGGLETQRGKVWVLR